MKNNTQTFSLADLDNDDVKPIEETTEEEKTDDVPPTDEDEEDEKDEEDENTEDENEESEESEEESEEDDSEDDDSGDTEEGEEEDEDSIDASFWEDVDELTGDPLDVDYGDVDPVSPEGVVIRERAVADREITRFEEAIKAKSPRAYAYLLHSLNGGTEEEFMQQADGVVELPTEDELELDEGLQKQQILKDLQDSGLSERHIKVIIKDAEEADELEELAKESLANNTKRRDDALAKMEENSSKELQRRTEEMNEMVTYVDKIVGTGKIGNIAIPKADRRGFAKEFQNSLRYENGKFLTVTELTEENLESVFQKEYFNYKKGDLSALVERKARSENTKRLVKKVNTKPKPKSTKHKSTGYTLGDI